MKKLDYSKIAREARAKGISPYLEAKRAVLYIAEGMGLDRHGCSDCRSMRKVTFDSRTGIQCEIIGVADEAQAWISNRGKCANYKYGR